MSIKQKSSDTAAPKGSAWKKNVIFALVVLALAAGIFLAVRAQHPAKGSGLQAVVDFGDGVTETLPLAQDHDYLYEVGDYIVHIDHGVGKFGGLLRTTVNGHPQEMIKLIYQNDDIVMVSIHALHKLAKYRGKEGVPPKINKLGGGALAPPPSRYTKNKEKRAELFRHFSCFPFFYRLLH